MKYSSSEDDELRAKARSTLAVCLLSFFFVSFNPFVFFIYLFIFLFVCLFVCLFFFVPSCNLVLLDLCVDVEYYRFVGKKIMDHIFCVT